MGLRVWAQTQGQWGATAGVRQDWGMTKFKVRKPCLPWGAGAVRGRQGGGLNQDGHSWWREVGCVLKAKGMGPANRHSE